MISEIGAVAIRLREEFGWCVLPAHYTHPPNQWHADPWCSCPRGRHCDAPGKHPVGAWNEHAVPGPLPIDQLRQAWACHPRYNIALLTGRRSGVVVADVDPRRGGTLDALWALGWSPATRIEQTGGGGWHVLAACPAEGLRSVDAYAPGIELKADGKLVIVAPSLHGSGRRYAWVPGHAPWECPPAPLPAEVLAGIAARQPEPQMSEPVALDEEQLTGLARRAPKLLDRALERVQADGGHGRYLTLKWLSKQLWSLRLSPEQLEHYLLAYHKEVWGNGE